MKIFETINSLQNKISSLKQTGKSIGFVPTMGALHEGHISLVKCSSKENDITVVSIFVNPTQFNNPEDLKKYPRTIEKDIEKLNNTKTNIIFVPSENEMYPEKDNRKFDFGNIATVMEGKHRPGHFNGVAQIVSKLFEAVKPNIAYFGQKDFQQYAIIKQLAKKYLSNLNIKIVSCPIIRELDGLAMSSRNVRLNTEQRKNATLISQTLFKAKETNNLKGCGTTVSELKKWVVEQINANKYLQVEYFEIVDNTNLNSIKNWNENNTKVACIAVFCGKIRLIDNLIF